MAASDSFRFAAGNLKRDSGKETPAKTFICEFGEIFKNIFWQDISGWLLLVIICQFWEVFQITIFTAFLYNWKQNINE